MPEPVLLIAVQSASNLRTAAAVAELRALFAQWRVKLMEVVKASVAECDDLFESQSHIPDGEVEVFKKKRAEWLDKFDKTLCDLFERRVIEGVRRHFFGPGVDCIEWGMMREEWQRGPYRWEHG